MIRFIFGDGVGVELRAWLWNHVFLFYFIFVKRMVVELKIFFENLRFYRLEINDGTWEKKRERELHWHTQRIIE